MFKGSKAGGFSLVELMVVVAIIGILASLAIPQVTKFQAKARQSEAKSMLSTIYSGEKAFYAEYSSYHSAFAAIGFSPEGSLRYNVGFMAGGSAGNAGAANGYNTAPVATASTGLYCGTAGAFTQGCAVLVGTSGGQPPILQAWAAGAIAGSVAGGFANTAAFVVPAATVAGACEVPAIVAGNSATFLACATAAVYNNNLDFWTVNQQKQVLNTLNGIP